MKKAMLGGAVVALISSGAMAANCDKNPSHPSCGGTPEPVADIGQLVAVDAIGRSVALVYPNVGRALAKIDGLPNIYLFNIQPGELDPNLSLIHISEPTRHTSQSRFPG